MVRSSLPKNSCDAPRKCRSDDRRRGHRLLRAAELAFELGRAGSVQQLIDSARRLPLTAEDMARVASLEGAFDDGVPGDAAHVRRLVEAASVAMSGGDDALATRLLTGAAMTCYWGAAPPELLARVREAMEQLSLAPSDPGAAMLLALLDPFVGGVAVSDVLDVWDGQPVDVNAAAALGRAAFVAGDFDRGLRFARRASDGLRAQGRVALLAQTLVLETFSAIYLGRWDVTNVCSAEALDLATETRQPVWAACARLGQANVAAVQGDRDRADDLAQRVEQTALLTGNRSLLNGVQLVRGAAALGAQDPSDAVIELRRMMEPADAAYQSPQSVWAIDHLAEAALLDDQRDVIRPIIARLTARTSMTNTPGVRRARALAAALLADESEADECFTRAPRAVGRSPGLVSGPGRPGVGIVAPTASPSQRSRATAGRCRLALRRPGHLRRGHNEPDTNWKSPGSARDEPDPTCGQRSPPKNCRSLNSPPTDSPTGKSAHVSTSPTAPWDPTSIASSPN